MDDRGRRVALMVGAIAAAAGVAVASYFYLTSGRRGNAASEESEAEMRNVNEVLTDCYARIQDIQRHLGELHAATAEPSQA